MSFSDAEWHEILTEQNNMPAYAMTTDACQPTQLDRAVTQERQEQRAPTPKLEALKCACGSVKFIVLRHVPARCNKCAQRTHCTPVCTACEKIGCFLCWFKVAATDQQPTSNEPAATPMTRCPVCMLAFDLTGLAAHWNDPEHYKRLVASKREQRFCSRFCWTSRTIVRPWVTFEEHVINYNKPITNALRPAGGCAKCGGLVFL